MQEIKCKSWKILKIHDFIKLIAIDSLKSSFKNSHATHFCPHWFLFSQFFLNPWWTWISKHAVPFRVHIKNNHSGFFPRYYPGFFILVRDALQVSNKGKKSWGKYASTERKVERVASDSLMQSRSRRTNKLAIVHIRDRAAETIHWFRARSAPSMQPLCRCCTGAYSFHYFGEFRSFVIRELWP